MREAATDEASHSVIRKMPSMKLTLNIDVNGDLLYLETPDGQVLPNITECKLPEKLPHDYKEGFPLVTFSFCLQDIEIRTIDMRAPTNAAD